jgi:MraZ protein
MVMVKTWAWTGAALVVVTGVSALLVIESRAGGRAVPTAADSQPAVHLQAPTGPVAQDANPGRQPGRVSIQPHQAPPREPQANLLQPVAAPAGPAVETGSDGSGRVTAARVPLPPETSPPALADGTTQAQGEVVRPMPGLAAAPRPRPSSRPRPLPFTGTYRARLDEGGALALPSDVRKRLQARAGRPVFVTPGPEACLYLYTADGLERWDEQLGQAAGNAARVRGARRLSLAQTEACTVDRAGRLHLPERLARFAGLRQDVVLIGVGDHLEAWDAGRWQQYQRRPDTGAEEACEP